MFFCFKNYKPTKLDVGLPHPDPVVETASLASVEPADVWSVNTFLFFSINIRFWGEGQGKKISSKSYLGLLGVRSF